MEPELYQWMRRQLSHIQFSVKLYVQALFIYAKPTTNSLIKGTEKQ